MNDAQNNYDEICYKRNFLSEVIARVDFLSPIEKIRRVLPKKISDSIKPMLPIGEPRKMIAHKIAISPKETKEEELEEFFEWRFRDAENERVLCISPNYIWIVYKKYKSYELLKKEFLSVFDSLFDTFKDFQGSRSGLRYINDINLPNGDPFSLEEYFNSDMLGLINLLPQKERAARIFSNIELNYGDFNVKHNFGLFNPDYPSPIKQKIFKIDLDAYYQGIQDPDEIKESFDDYHSKIQELFELSVTNSLRDIMNG